MRTVTAKTRVIRAALAISILLSLWLGLPAPAPAHAATCAFRNPLITLGQDPSVVFQDGSYYLVQSTASGIVIKKSSQLTELGNAPGATVFSPPIGQPYSADIWAPELITLNGAWYIYFAATASPNTNPTHRLYVLQADTGDPLGTWSYKGKVYKDAATDKWAIDGSVFTYKGQLYMVWSGWPGDTGDFPENLYIATMTDPLTVSGVRHQIATPDQSWEKSVASIEEGPEPFIHNGQLSIVYSADASWTEAYKLGMLKLTGSDPLDAASWTKVGPIFHEVKSDAGAAYGPGHNSIPVKSPDGSQDWLVYHVKSLETNGWDDRQIYAQPFTWNADNTPNLGEPAVSSVPVPSGEPCGLASYWPLDGNAQPAASSAKAGTLIGSPTWTSGKIGGALDFNGTSALLDLNDHQINTMVSYSVGAWVRLDRTDGTYAVISQDGGISSEFALQYSTSAGNKFVFTMFSQTGEINAQAVSSFSPTPGIWYQVLGVRDTLTQEVRLYVNGKLEGKTSYNADWATKGHTIVGAAREHSKRAEFFAGTIDDVRLIDGALSDAEVTALFAQRVASR